MRKLHLVAAALAGGLWLLPAPGAHAAPRAETVVWQVAGIHCPPCVQAIEGALRKTPGVSKLHSSVKDHLVQVTYDPSRADLARLAQTIAQTPSPMPNTHFQPALVLGVKGVRAEADASRLRAALQATGAVRRADARAGSGAVVLALSGGKTTRLSDLSAAAKRAGFSVTPVTLASAARAVSPSSSQGGEQHGSGQGMGGCCQ